MRSFASGSHIWQQPQKALSEGQVLTGDLQVVRRWALAHAARSVVVAAVAGAEPAVPVAGVGQRHAAQVRAHAHHHQPLRRTPRRVVSHQTIAVEKCSLREAANDALLRRLIAH